jgi:hypothetical protein
VNKLLREEYKFRLSEKRILRISGFTRSEAIGEYKKTA